MSSDFGGAVRAGAGVALGAAVGAGADVAAGTVTCGVGVTQSRGWTIVSPVTRSYETMRTPDSRAQFCNVSSSLAARVIE
jgi:hypothetical protein